LDVRLKEAKEGKRKVYFMNAAHFVFAVFLNYVWCFAKLTIKVPTGRQRLSVLGAIDAITKEMTYVDEDAYVSADSVCRLLDKISTGGKIPVTVFLDNARYQKCKKVVSHAEKLKIKLAFLPSYSPNLNLIERY
jgi:hypothetical protein